LKEFFFTEFVGSSSSESDCVSGFGKCDQLEARDGLEQRRYPADPNCRDGEQPKWEQQLDPATSQLAEFIFI
jgi:hypothetical protein